MRKLVTSHTLEQDLVNGRITPKVWKHKMELHGLVTYNKEFSDLDSQEIKDFKAHYPKYDDNAYEMRLLKELREDKREERRYLRKQRKASLRFELDVAMTSGLIYLYYFKVGEHYKIGITKLGVRQRYSLWEHKNFSAIRVWQADEYIIKGLERHFLYKYKHLRGIEFQDTILKSGNTELFSLDVLTADDLAYIEARTTEI